MSRRRGARCACCAARASSCTCTGCRICSGPRPQEDAADFARLFDDPDFRPDELKLYPCSLIESAELMAYYERGEWRPYTHDELVDLLVADCLERTPSYCRVTRVIRDFSAHDIAAGNRVANSARGCGASSCAAAAVSVGIFALEKFAKRSSSARAAALVPIGCTRPRSVTSTSWSSPHQRIASSRFCDCVCRVSPLPESRVARTSALIREVHVYGGSLGTRTSARTGRAQHIGLGRRLIERAELAGPAGGFVRSGCDLRGGHARLLSRPRVYRRRVLPAPRAHRRDPAPSRYRVGRA